MASFHNAYLILKSTLTQVSFFLPLLFFHLSHFSSTYPWCRLTGTPSPRHQRIRSGPKKKSSCRQKKFFNKIKAKVAWNFRTPSGRLRSLDLDVAVLEIGMTEKAVKMFCKAKDFNSISNMIYKLNLF